nr:ChaN family lipoprotein [Elizabethkingia bruuniana]
MRKLLFAFAMLCISGIKAQQFDAYKFYNKKGKAVKAEKIVKQLSDYDVVLFGELHNNSIVHWLQLKFTEALYQQKNNQLILGAEMFEEITSHSWIVICLVNWTLRV